MRGRECAGEPEHSSRPLTTVLLITPHRSSSHQVLVDSGADEIFMDWQLADQLGLQHIPLTKPLEASALDVRMLCRVTHRTQTVQLTMAGNHTEFISFHLFNSAFHPLILGLPWLIEHNPQMNWATGEILAWSNKCALTCCSHSPASETPTLLPGSQPPEPASTPVSAEADFPDLSNVPSCYLDQKEVFNMAKATSLPPHRPYDCCINLLPGTSPRRGRLYSLSAPEQVAMQKYINDALAAGIIQPSSSPAGAGFFFVGKKYKSHRLYK